MNTLILPFSHGLLFVPHFFKLLVLFLFEDRRNTSYYSHFFSILKMKTDMPQAAYLLLGSLIESSHSGTAVLFASLHFLHQFLFCQLAEVTAFLDGFLDHFLLMLPFLRKLFQHWSLLALVTWKKSYYELQVYWTWTCTSLIVKICWFLHCCRSHLLAIYVVIEDTLRRSSAASSFFLIPSRDISFFLRGVNGNSPLASGAEGLRMTSNAWPEARLFSTLTWISVKQHIC